MADLLKRFNQTVSGSNTKVGDYKSRIVAKGDFQRIEGLEVIINSWNNILTTPRRSYQYDPNYGSDLYKLIFEPGDEITAQRIENEVINTLIRYDDRATISDITVLFYDDRKAFMVSAVVTYNNQSADLQLVFDDTTYFKFFETTETS
jgi:phage baseplate assembly protein W